MAKNFVMYSEDIDFSAKNFRKLAFRFNNSNCWMSFFENFSTTKKPIMIFDNGNGEILQL